MIIPLFFSNTIPCRLTPIQARRHFLSTYWIIAPGASYFNFIAKNLSGVPAARTSYTFHAHLTEILAWAFIKHRSFSPLILIVIVIVISSSGISLPGLLIDSLITESKPREFFLLTKPDGSQSMRR